MNEFDDGTKMEDVNEDDPRLTDKNIPENVPMEDAPGLIDKSFGDFVDEFLRYAGVIYETLEAEDHKHQYCLIGNLISVAIRRLPYKKGESNEHSKNHAENETVGLAPEDQSKVEPVEECSSKEKAKEEGEGSKEIETNSEEGINV